MIAYAIVIDYAKVIAYAPASETDHTAAYKGVSVTRGCLLQGMSVTRGCPLQGVSVTRWCPWGCYKTHAVPRTPRNLRGRPSDSLQSCEAAPLRLPAF